MSKERNARWEALRFPMAYVTVALLFVYGFIGSWVLVLNAAVAGALSVWAVMGLSRLARSALPRDGERWRPRVGAFVGLLIGAVVGGAWGFGCSWLLVESLGPDPSPLAAFIMPIWTITSGFAGLLAGLFCGMVVAASPDSE